MNFNRSSGILLHPTSLPAKFGIGDFGPSAYQFVDFLEHAQQTLWQILPLGPTSFGDSPYQSFSTFAGNPMLISPELLQKEGYLEDSDIHNTPDFSCHKVDYGTVIEYKNTLFKKAYAAFKKNTAPSVKKEFELFCNKNAYWLDDYSLFVSLKDYFIEKRKFAGFTPEFQSFEKKTGAFLTPAMQKDYYFGAVWSTWPEELIKRKPTALNIWSRRVLDSMKYYKFLQFMFHKQWVNLKKYTNKKGIQIIGDIPIFVAYDSADAWSNPKNYYMDEKGFPVVVAGVPPDYFSVTGQLWGNPLYNFEEHKKNDYKWWISRIKHTLTMVDIVRIDHFRGFEGFWSVPFGDIDATGGKWQKGPGASLFLAVEKALGKLPIIAEDLGVITEQVTKLRTDFHFPGMKVLQFAFDDSKNNDYLPHNYEKNAVVYTGTHDNDTTVGWYQKASFMEQDKFRRYMNVDGSRPSWDMIRLAMSSTAVFSIFPLQDVLSLDSSGRMNTPSTAAHNWQFRFDMNQLNGLLEKELAYLTELFARKTVLKTNISGDTSK